MLERRKNSKILPIVFLFLQIIASFLLSYFIYILLVEVGVSSTLVLVLILIGNIFFVMKFFARYIEVKHRTKHVKYR